MQKFLRFTESLFESKKKERLDQLCDEYEKTHQETVQLNHEIQDKLNELDHLLKTINKKAG